MSWQPEIDELSHRKKLAMRMGGEESIQRHHSHGKLTVRERIDKLLDKDTFHETGMLTGNATYDEDGRLIDFTPANIIIGVGKIDDRKVVVAGNDFNRGSEIK